MSRLVVALLLLMLAVPALADRVYLESGITRDGDESGHQRVTAGYRLRSGELHQWELDLGGGTRDYWEKIAINPGNPNSGETREKEAFSVARAVLRGAAPETWRYDLRLEQLLSSDWDVAVGGATLSAKPNKTWYLELFAEREIVDTVRAIREHVTVSTYGVSADYHLTPSLVLVAALLQQDFSDSNLRTGGTARLIYYPETPEWLHLQLKGRILDADKPSDLYFSPERMQEYYLLAGIATPFAGDDWVIRLLGGPGIQLIEPFGEPREEKNAYQVEVKLRGWFTDNLTLEGDAGCSTSITSTDTYAYCFANLHLGYAW